MALVLVWCRWRSLSSSEIDASLLLSFSLYVWPPSTHQAPVPPLCQSSQGSFFAAVFICSPEARKALRWTTRDGVDRLRWGGVTRGSRFGWGPAAVVVVVVVVEGEACRTLNERVGSQRGRAAGERATHQGVGCREVASSLYLSLSTTSLNRGDERPLAQAARSRARPRIALFQVQFRTAAMGDCFIWPG
ncbi:hypothetical protein BDV95DRAFT_654498 [Massariosphaeria phaeospora]|uniref:Uncharacterized protein n=1 Tax=Massariosphaeria phaeospora TaxID=100035 RepID=A0A7C8IFM6_9PLEO|nr:hypothetical protein BDV95DRAFT_654498 [Massariosphaeria phaeospora]